MVTAYVMDIPQSSHDTTSIIDFVRKIYTKSATYFSKVKFALLALILVPIVVILSLPFLLILLSFIKASKIRLKMALKKDLKISPNNYKEAKEMQRSLHQDLVIIQAAINLFSEKSVFMSSIFIEDIKDTYAILSTFQEKLDRSLSDLAKNDSETKYFVLIPEQTLWDNRVEAYQYRL